MADECAELRSFLDAWVDRNNEPNGPAGEVDPVRRVARWTAVQRIVEHALHEEVTRARASGATWRVVASAMGIPLTTAYQRFNDSQS